MVAAPKRWLHAAEMHFQEISLATTPNAFNDLEDTMPARLIERGVNATREAELDLALRTCALLT